MPPDGDSSTFDPTIQSEDIAFRSNELVACSKCSRANAPDRANCLYCGAALDLTSAPEVLKRRKLEIWEKGWNLIATGAHDPSTSEAAVAIGFSYEAMADVLRAGTPLPIARVESANIAELLSQKVSELGVETRVISDEELMADVHPVRLRGLAMSEDGLRLDHFNTADTIEAAWGDVALMVAGMIVEGRTASVEKRRRNKESKLLHSSEESTDRLVLDLFTRDDPRGFRIYPTGFDFSFLGERKGVLAADNLRLLIDEIKRRAPVAHYTDDFRSVSGLVGEIWEPDARQEGTGLIRAGFGKRGWGSVATTSNLRQFTKYSRMHWYLL